MITKIVYKGVQYNIFPFLSLHPGGKAYIEQFLKFKIDITEFFLSTHSKEAEEKLLSLHQMGRAQRRKHERTYSKIEEKVRKLYPPSFFIEITLIMITMGLFVSTFLLSHPAAIIAALTSSQIMGAWVAHSLLHQRRERWIIMGNIVGSAILGLSRLWWKHKHFKHHTFTNHIQIDPDLQPSYPVYLYPFMLLKWRIDSVKCSIRFFTVEYFYFVIILAHYIFLLLRLRFAIVLVSLCLASLYLAVVSQGNHQREHRFKGGLNDFLTEQLQSTRNYAWKGFMSNYLLGGFNFHVQHHLFPQIPFYRLQKAHRIIKEELALHKQKIETGDIII